MTPCTIMLRNNATGEVRAIPEDNAWSEIEFLWTEGNFGCDCNRDLLWHRAGNILTEDEIDEPCHCGDGAFTIVSVVSEPPEKDD